MLKSALCACAIAVLGSLPASPQSWISGNNESCGKVCADHKAYSLTISGTPPEVAFVCAGLLEDGSKPNIRVGENFLEKGKFICRLWGGSSYTDVGKYDCLCSGILVKRPNPM